MQPVETSLRILNFDLLPGYGTFYGAGQWQRDDLASL